MTVAMPSTPPPGPFVEVVPDDEPIDDRGFCVSSAAYVEPETPTCVVCPTCGRRLRPLRYTDVDGRCGVPQHKPPQEG